MKLVAPNLIAILLIILFPPNGQAQTLVDFVGRFDSNKSVPPPDWQIVRFDQSISATHYRVINWEGVDAVEAVANASMALLARPLNVNLDLTPVLCWKWRVDAPLKSANMTRKAGDDYAARVYIAFKLPDDSLSFITRAKLALARNLYGGQVPDAAINYVWDNQYPIGTQHPNAYTDRTQMIVTRSGSSESGRWVTERQDVLADGEQYFGKNALSPTLLAIASDTDNTGESARAGFADFHFVARTSPCFFDFIKSLN